MPAFTPTTATVQEKQEYAACVQHLFPKNAPSIPYEVSVFIAVVLLAGTVGGAIVAYRSDYGGDLGDAVMGSVLGFLAACLGLAIVGVIFALLTGAFS